MMVFRVLLLCFTSASALIAPRSTIARGRLVARAPRARAPQMAVAQYAGQAASLFNNMKTPASILAGALLPIGILTALPPPREGAEKEHAWLGALRQLGIGGANSSFDGALPAELCGPLRTISQAGGAGAPPACDLGSTGWASGGACDTCPDEAAACGARCPTDDRH